MASLTLNKRFCVETMWRTGAFSLEVVGHNQSVEAVQQLSEKLQCDLIVFQNTESQNVRGWKGPLWVI